MDFTKILTIVISIEADSFGQADRRAKDVAKLLAATIDSAFLRTLPFPVSVISVPPVSISS